jgi:hypothetical protein
VNPGVGVEIPGAKVEGGDQTNVSTSIARLARRYQWPDLADVLISRSPHGIVFNGMTGRASVGEL